jgi:hypothetical protein
MKGPTPARLVAWSLVGHLALVVAALRQNFAYGAGYPVLGVDSSTWLQWGQGVALAVFVVTAGIAFLRAERAVVERVPGFDDAAILRGGIVLVVAATLTPPFLSSDVFDNLARGRVEAVHGANPYLTPAATFVGDPSLVLADWTSVVMLYGPLTAIVQTAFAWLAGDALWVGVYLFKALYGACHVLTALLVRDALRRLAPAAATPVFVAWLWNPFLLLETAGSAHNDAQMALMLAACVAALARDRIGWATFAFGAAVLTKHGCAVLGPLLLAYAWWRGRVAAFAGGVVATAALAAPLALHYFATPGGLDWLAKPTSHSGTSALHLSTVVAGVDAGTALRVGYGVTLVVLAFAVARVRGLDGVARGGAVVTLTLLAVAMPLYSPWYHLWWLPLVGLAPLPASRAVLRVLAIAGPASYLVYQATGSFGPAHQVWQWSLTLAVPFGVWLAVARRRATG